MNDRYDIAVIGGGPAGLAAAIEARKRGVPRVLVIERNDQLGGILPQCIHNGFGAKIFGEDLPGPLYAHRFAEEAKASGAEFMLGTMAMGITPDLKLYAANHERGYFQIEAGAVVLAMGCRERTRAQIKIPGTRPAGVFTAGTVQRFVNIEGFMPGAKFVILGSGDIGMIMARRLTLEGAKVLKVVEILPFLTGLRRNYVQCLKDFDIPLELSTTVKRIIGRERVEAVETALVDHELKPVPGTEETIDCDTLLLSVGLIPENELSLRAGVELDPITGGPYVDNNMATNVPGIFAAGNVVSIYDLADEVSNAGYIAGASAAEWITGGKTPMRNYAVLMPGENVRSIVPQRIELSGGEDVPLMLRSSKVFEGKVRVVMTNCGGEIGSFPRKYARPAEMIGVDLKIAEFARKLKSSELPVIVSIVPREAE
ncbi:MAG: pyridine nucleotide-disulfide oxidoreductase [Spirochaetes bacterium GWF1_51_8]|nr:MAG: pyridine nucleotide-disulfide oxidoreductase [Spirochaetes bacterium GWF1_51_8]